MRPSRAPHARPTQWLARIRAAPHRARTPPPPPCTALLPPPPPGAALPLPAGGPQAAVAVVHRWPRRRQGGVRPGARGRGREGGDGISPASRVAAGLVSGTPKANRARR
eukprot:scaffold5365_cov115-Isochrysis_galbana.AAC.6